ncbi:MAG TPA: hypothetical protein VD833_11355 [Vicinamibacterales bacterium]|nr:hypothetical protein [Vicinamibacterales bacterium]
MSGHCELFACLRSTHEADDMFGVAQEFSPRIQRYGAGCVVLEVGGLERLLGDARAIGIELCRAVERFQTPARVAAPGGPIPGPRYRGIFAHPREHAALCFDRFHPGDADIRQEPAREETPERDGWATAGEGLRVAVAVAPTQTAALLLARASFRLSVVTSDPASALADIPLTVLRQWLADVHGATYYRGRLRRSMPGRGLVARSRWPAWESCEHLFDVLHRWGIRTLGAFAALPSDELAARVGQPGLEVQRLARGADTGPLVPDPAVRRFVERMELEWPIDSLEPLSFVLARLLEPLSVALGQADRAAAAIRLELRLVDRAVHQRVLQLPAALRDPRVLRTLLLLDLESHPPSAAIDVVTIEIDPAPGRILQYSLLERATPSTEAVATLMARLGALVGPDRCGTPELIDTHRADGFRLQGFRVQGSGFKVHGSGVQGSRVQGFRVQGFSDGAEPVGTVLRRYRPPVAVRVAVEGGRPVQVAIARRGMPGGAVLEASGPWRSSGGWWDGAATRWDRDEWDVAFSDGAVCRLYRTRDDGRWYLDAVVD